MNDNTTQEIQWIPREDITPSAYNPRVDLQPDDQDYKDIKASLDEFGLVQPLVWNRRTGNLVAGHQRYKILASDGMMTMPCVVVDLDLDGEKRLNLMLNAVAGRWEEKLLATMLSEMKAAETRLDVPGFDSAEIKRLLKTLEPAKVEQDFDPDSALEDAKAHVVSQRGDVWILGDHRLMCGDSTNHEDVLTLMAGQRAAMCFTDPPWNVAIGNDSNPRHRRREGLINDDLSAEDFQAFLRGFAGVMQPVLDGDLYCVLGANEWPTLDSTLRSIGYHWSGTIIWAKNQFVLGRAKYHRRYEPIWYGWHTKGKSSYAGDRKQDDVWEFDRPRVSAEHPTMKPVPLVRKAIENSSRLGDNVLDPFSGSGTTLIACEETGRRCFTMDINENYTDVAVRRWEHLTGQTAVKER